MKVKQFFYLLLGLVFLGAIGYAIHLAAFGIAELVVNMSPALQATVATGTFAIVGALLAFFSNKYLNDKRSTEESIRPKKLQLYEEFITFIMRIFSKEEMGKKPTEDEMMNFFVEKTPDLIKYASNDVIKKWGKLRISLASANGTKSLFLMEDFFKEVRKDLGHPKFRSSRGDILRLFINDIDEYIKK